MLGHFPDRLSPVLRPGDAGLCRRAQHPQPRVVPLLQRDAGAGAVCLRLPRRAGSPSDRPDLFGTDCCLELLCPLPRGLEPLLADELRAIGATDPKCVPGGVQFSGDWALCYRANLESRIATRVLWRSPWAATATRKMSTASPTRPPGPAGFPPDETIRVFVTAHKSPLRSLEFVTLKIRTRCATTSAPLSDVAPT